MAQHTSNPQQSMTMKIKQGHRIVKKQIMSSESKQQLRPFRRDPISEFISSRLGAFIIILIIALFCDIFVAKPALHQRGMTEVQLVNEIMQKTGVLSNFESTIRFINATIPTGIPDPKNRPGYILANKGAKAKYPVVLVPGFITSGLELWAGEECAKKYFRQKFWGSLPIFVQSFFTDMKCYTRHLALDPFTGSDPEHIKLRSAQGFDAADYFFSSFWVWNKLIDNLSDVGYDSSSMIMMSYDWRLSFPMLEERDGYFTKLKMNIEAMRKTAGRPVVLTSHSMGSQIVLYFFKWVAVPEIDGGGGGGEKWVEENIKDFVNIAGPLLGVPKSVPALLSGEMKDTASLIGPMGTMVEKFFPKRDRQKLWSTWGSLWEMLPKGGEAIWETSHDLLQGNKTFDSNLFGYNAGTDNDVCVDNTCESSSHTYTGGSFITFAETLQAPKNRSTYANRHTTITLKGEEREWTVTDAIDFLTTHGAGYGNGLHASQQINQPNSEAWSDPTVTPLPKSRSMKIYCLYGVGLKTERSYFYKRDLSNNQHLNGEDVNLPFTMDASVHNPDENINFGTRTVDGDVSVPLVSLGYLCADKWRKSKDLNPSGIHVITREYSHKEEFQVNDPMRGGPYSSEHVDILGNVDATMDLLKIVTGFSETLNDHFVSDIESISRKINLNSIDR